MDERVTRPVTQNDQCCGQGVPVTRFSTGELSPAEQFDAWSTYVRPVAEVSLIEPARNGFNASFATWSLGSMAFCRLAMPKDGPARAWRHAANPSADHWYVALDRGSGKSTGRHGTKRSLHVRSLASRHEGISRSEALAGIMIPRDLFVEAAPMLDRVAEDIPDVGPGAMLADYIMTVDRHLDDLTLADTPALASATKAMILFCLAPSIDRAEMARGPINAITFEKARAIIQRSLMLPDLDADVLCRRMGVSRSRLYRMFDSVGGVNNYIRRQRLLLARAALSDLEDLRPIGVIASSFGFTDASGFSRAYHREFGCSPSDTRMERLSGRAVALPITPAPPTSGTSRLDDLLRRLKA